jgi:hypothetical protein
METQCRIAAFPVVVMTLFGSLPQGELVGCGAKSQGAGATACPLYFSDPALFLKKQKAHQPA